MVKTRARRDLHSKGSPSRVFSPVERNSLSNRLNALSSGFDKRLFTATEAFRPISTADLRVSVKISACPPVPQNVERYIELGVCFR